MPTYDRDAFVDWRWVGDHLGELGTDLLEHLRLTLLAVGFGIALSAALTVLGLRLRWLLPPVTVAAGLLYTIPSLAAFVVLIPVFGLTDDRTVLLPLISYTLFILMRSFVAGIDGVPADVRDAADGMGYRRWRRLVRIELPLALPAIVAGIRIATVTTVGLVTVSALVGFGGLGSQITEGLTRRFSTQIVVGGGLSLVLALVIDVVLIAVERVSTPWRRVRVAAEPMLERTA